MSVLDRKWMWVAGLLLLGVGTVAVVAADPGGDDGPAREHQTLATVGDYTISVERFNESYVQYLLRTGGTDSESARHAHLNRLLDDRLLAEAARRHGLDQEEAFLEYAERQRKLAIGARYFETVIADSLPPLTEAEVRDAFRKSKQQVVLRHLHFRDPAEARAAYERLEGGEDYLALANEVFGTAAFDSLAGYLGVASYWNLDDAVAEAAFSLPVGQYSRPVRSRYGWHIVRVEDRLVNPLLTESEYQYRREGIEGKARIRRNRLVADRLVREMMEAAEVDVDEAGARLLIEAAARAQEQETDTAGPEGALTSEEITVLRDALTPETVLLTYTLDGVRHTFTAMDYYRWLPELPSDEIRNRVMASVGRALRNEVLARHGRAAGLADDPHVQEAVTHMTNGYLADRMRAHLREHGPAEPTDEQVREAFERLGYRTLVEARASYWHIPFETLAEARTAREAIDSGERRASTFPDYESYESRDLKRMTGPLGGHLRQVPTDQPVVICTGDATCHVVEVAERTLRYSTLEEKGDAIRAELREHLPVLQHLDSLYQTTAVEVDTSLFREMMTF